MSFYETLISRLNKRFSSIDKPSIRRYLNRLFDDDRLQYRIEPDRFLLNNSVRLEPLSHYSGLVLNGIRIERKIIQPSVTPKVEIDNEVSVYYKDRETGAKLVKTADITPGGTSKGGYLIKFSDNKAGDTTVFGSANANKLVMVILTTPTANRDKVAATDTALIASLAQN
jgi:hypothetical protein